MLDPWSGRSAKRSLGSKRLLWWSTLEDFWGIELLDCEDNELSKEERWPFLSLYCAMEKGRCDRKVWVRKVKKKKNKKQKKRKTRNNI